MTGYNEIAFVIAAYAVTGVVLGGLVGLTVIDLVRAARAARAAEAERRTDATERAR